jgi:thioredoxin 1
MPGKIVPVTSASHFSTLLSQSTYTVVDFYADWCGPCKAIAPVFQGLAEKETKPGKMQFVKVDVDSQQEVAKTYGVSAYVLPPSTLYIALLTSAYSMPTFLIIKNSSVVDTIRGANPAALTAAVRKASSDTSSPGASFAAFSSKGRTLGSASEPSRPVGESPFAGLQRMIMGNGGLSDVVVRFAALYFVSLFAFDAFKAAEDSAFSVRARR